MKKRFNKGDAIPHWVLSPDVPAEVIFGADVVVVSSEEGVTVRPQKQLGDKDALAIVNYDGPVTLTGAPTRWDCRPIGS
jgi:hypothetical protein